MPTISDYITQLQTDKGTLKTNLETKGITGLSDSDTFTELVPEVLNIEAVNNQSKSETITTNGTTTISPDTGYTGLSEVEITTNIVPDYSTMYANTIAPGTNNITGIAKTIKSIPVTLTPTDTSLYKSFSDCNNLVTAPNINSSNVTIFTNMFYNCSNLTSVPAYNTNSATDMSYMFYNCSNLTSVPQFDTSHVTNFRDMFNYCTGLTTLPVLDTSSATNFQNMFGGGVNSLTNDSLNNLLYMLAHATIYTGTKTLQQVFGYSTRYSKTLIEGLSNYQAFTDAGWSIGW